MYVQLRGRPELDQCATTPSASVIDTSTASGATASSPPASPTPSVIDVPTPSSAPPTLAGPAAQEAADRAAVEAAWVEFWKVYEAIVRTAKGSRAAELASVAVAPCFRSTCWNRFASRYRSGY